MSQEKKQVQSDIRNVAHVGFQGAQLPTS